MQTLKDEDNNVYNIKLKIINNQLLAYNKVDTEAEPYVIDLNRDIIDIIIK